MPSSFVSISACPVAPDVAVVIDVLRAFTTAAWAFELGVDRIVLTDDLDEALRIKARLPGALAMKDGEPELGFDLTNSPVQLRRRDDLAGKTIIQRTTHGTIGAVAARNARALYCSAFTSAAATAAAIRRDGGNDVCFVVTGDDGMADEDLACAEYIAALLEGPATDARPFVERVGASRAAARIRRLLAEGARGFDSGDIALCSEADRFDFTMQAAEEDGLLVLRRQPVHLSDR
jgi:2-phosphosulfolactate phosphatase